MCRVLGSVAAEPISLRSELLEAANPLIRPDDPDADGWGMATYPRGEGEEPACSRFPTGCTARDMATAQTRGRIHNVHVRRATIGGPTPENTHPFCLGPYSFSHNGTVVNIDLLDRADNERPQGDTDSERLFRLVMHHLDSEDPIDGLRYAMTATIERFPFSSLTFLFSDGERLYAYRLGNCELHWQARANHTVVASERTNDDENWHSVKQDVLLVLDPREPDEPHAERLVGDALLARADIRADHAALTAAE